MNKHACIKCGAQYEDKDVDAYLCNPCNAIRLQIAKEVDSKLASRPKKTFKSDFQIAEELGKTIQSASGNGKATYVRASDLGITFN